MNAIELAAGWLCTFAAHSTVLAGGVLLACSLLRRRAIALQEAVCRFSLWGALVSASAQWFLLGGPVGPVPAVAPMLPFTAPAPAAGEGPAMPAADAMVGLRTATDSLPLLSADPVLCLGAAALAVLGLAMFLRAHLGLRRLLARRVPETDVRVLRAAAVAARDLGLRTTPRLSRSTMLPSPIAFGFVQQEVCLPERSAELDDGGLRAMLTHELAHLRRRDPAWLCTGAVLQALFPWQVLFFFLRHRLHELGELRCDAEAAAATSPVAVARCLLSVADWLRPGAALPRGALAMAARPSALRERVEMALAGRAPARVRRTTVVLLGAACLAGLTAAAPGSRTAPVLDEHGRRDDEARHRDEGGFARRQPALLAPLLDEHALLLAEAAALPAAMPGEDAELANLRAALDERLAHLTLTLERLAAAMQAGRSRTPMDQGDRR